MVVSVSLSCAIGNSSVASSSTCSLTSASVSHVVARGQATASCYPSRAVEHMPGSLCGNKGASMQEPRCSFLSEDGITSSKVSRHAARSVHNRDRLPFAVVSMSMRTDYYAVLGIAKSASKQDIKGAYRRLARKYHPDMNKAAGAEEKFKEISAAYEVLSDDEKKSMYDSYGETGIRGGVAGNGTGAYAGTDPFDLFESIFGTTMGGDFNGRGSGMGMFFRTSGHSMPSQGDDLRFDVSLEFEEAIFGTERGMETSHLETCTSCNGSGARSSNSQKRCSTCDGQGQVMQTRRTEFGMLSQVSVCPTCAGEGEIVTSYCKKCGGEGRVRVRKLIKVKVPPGVNSGSTLRVRGEGDAGLRGGPPGDLYVYLNVKEMPNVQRDGTNLYSSVTIIYTDAILGTIVQVKTIDGSTDLQIPPGTQPGDVLVLPKRGVPNLNKPTVRGDHRFIVQVSIPTQLSETERVLIEQLADFYKAKVAQSNGSKAHTGTTQGRPTKNETEVGDATVRESVEGEGFWASLKKLAGWQRAGFGSISMHAMVLQEPSCPPPTPLSPHLLFVHSVLVLSLMTLSVGPSLLYWALKRFLNKRKS